MGKQLTTFTDPGPGPPNSTESALVNLMRILIPCTMRKLGKSQARHEASEWWG